MNLDDRHIRIFEDDRPDHLWILTNVATRWVCRVIANDGRHLRWFIGPYAGRRAFRFCDRYGWRADRAKERSDG